MKPEDLPIEVRLIQLAEEAAELSQAALKLVRARYGDTPVTQHQASAHLLEEMADVSVCMTALQDIAPLARVGEIIAQKAQRWEDRINGKE